MLLKISQNSHENTCGRASFLTKLQAWRPATLLKKRLWHRCFAVNFTKFLRTPFLTEHIRWLLLDFWKHEPFYVYVQVLIRTITKFSNNDGNFGHLCVRTKWMILRNSLISEAAFRRCSSNLKNFEIFTGKQLWWNLFLIIFNNLLKKEIPIQLSPCEYCEIFKNSCFHRTPLSRGCFYELIIIKH